MASEEEQPVFKVGWLVKLGSNFKTWKRRWFVLGIDRLSYYCESSADLPSKKGYISIDDSTTVVDRELSHSSKTYRFAVCTGARCLELSAGSDEQKLVWIDAINSVLKLNSDVPTRESWISHLERVTEQECGDPGDPTAVDKILNILDSAGSIAATAVGGTVEKVNVIAKEATSATAGALGELRRKLSRGDTGDFDWVDVGDSDSFDEYEADADHDSTDGSNINSPGLVYRGFGYVGGLFSTARQLPSKRDSARYIPKVAAVLNISFLLLFIVVLNITFRSVGNLLHTSFILAFVVIVLVYHDHILAVVAEKLLRKYFLGRYYSSDESFNIKFAGVRLHIGLDLCVIEARRVEWCNPSQFEQYGRNFIEIKNIRLAIPSESFYRYFVCGEYFLKVEQLSADNLTLVIAQKVEQEEVHSVGRYNFATALGWDIDSTNAAMESNGIDEEVENNEDFAEELINEFSSEPEGSPSVDAPAEDVQALEQDASSLFDVKLLVLTKVKIRLINIMKVKSHFFRVPYILLNREELTKKDGSGHRIGIDIYSFVGILRGKILSRILANHKTTVVRFLSSAGTRQMLWMLDLRNAVRLWKRSQKKKK